MSWKSVHRKGKAILASAIALVSIVGVQFAGVPTASAATGHCGAYDWDSATNGLYNMCGQVRAEHTWGVNAPGGVEYGPWVKLGYVSYNICRPYERSYSYQYSG